MSTPSSGEDKRLDNTTKTGRLEWTNLILLSLATVLTSCNVLLGRYTRTGVDPDDLYNVAHLVVIGEIFKLILSCGMEHYTTGGKLLSSLKNSVLAHPKDALKMLAPTLLYLVQNTLIYVALSNLTAPLFQVTYQGKLVAAAILSVFMLQRKYSQLQWICIVVLSLGVAIVVSGEESKFDATGQNLLVGLAAVSIACLSSAMGGVVLEGILKRQPASLWMRNMQLAFFSLVVAGVQGLLKRSGNAEQKSYLHGFTPSVWALVLVQGSCGLLAAAVMKHADNVKKGLSTGVSVILSTVLSIAFFGTPLTARFVFGSGLILAAVYFFINPTKKRSTVEKDTEMKQLLRK